MKILHICTMNHSGAGGVALRLHIGLKSLGVQSKMLVLFRRSSDSDVIKVKKYSMNSFKSLANENNSTYASLFAKYVAEHLRSYGINTATIEYQTDNGSEFIGSVRKRINRLSAFEKTLKKYDIYHGRIPPRSSYLQGDVETFHKIIEDELYDIENYANPVEFLGKAYAYQLYFNYARENRWRDNKSPLQLLRERSPHLDEGILNLPPIRLEILLDEELKSGYDVPGSATNYLALAFLLRYHINNNFAL